MEESKFSGNEKSVISELMWACKNTPQFTLIKESLLTPDLKKQFEEWGVWTDLVYKDLKRGVFAKIGGTVPIVAQQRRVRDKGVPDKVWEQICKMEDWFMHLSTDEEVRFGAELDAQDPDDKIWIAVEDKMKEKYQSTHALASTGSRVIKRFVKYRVIRIKHGIDFMTGTATDDFLA